jgi:hypothetical protein
LFDIEIFRRFSLDFFFRGHNDKIFCLRWNPYDDNLFVTVGVKHIKFWTKAGGGMTAKQGVFGKAAGKPGKQNQMCVVEKVVFIFGLKLH